MGQSVDVHVTASFALSEFKKLFTQLNQQGPRCLSPHTAHTPPCANGASYAFMEFIPQANKQLELHGGEGEERNSQIVGKQEGPRPRKKENIYYYFQLLLLLLHFPDNTSFFGGTFLLFGPRRRRHMRKVRARCIVFFRRAC